MNAVKNKIVLITGGTGSLGVALTERICSVAKKVIIFSRCELKQAVMQKKFEGQSNIRYMLGDIRDKSRLLFALSGVDVCIHAACYKRIDSCSYNPFEAVKTNVTGSMNVAEACIERQIPKVIFISTDKSCEAATLYGGTKFVAEQMFINANNYSSYDDTVFSMVRYGNIYGSNGSVKHIFERQAKDDGVISITHKDMTRFFMSLDDACDLILYCAENMIGGEIFVPQMKSVSIAEYANIVAPGVPHKVIGLRAHEKIHEKLISDTESQYVVKCNDRYFKIVPTETNIPGVMWDSKYPVEPREEPFVISSDTAERFSEDEVLAFDEKWLRS